MRALLLLLLAVTAPAVAAPSPDCVVLLHGLARTPRSMAPLATALREQGYVVANIGYPSRSEPIEVLANRAVKEGIDTCRASTGGDIHFVGHSLGGILVRYYLAHHELPELGRVVMLAPPNQGSEVVDRWSRVPGFGLVNGPAGAQLGTGEGSLPAQLGAVDYPVGVIAGTRSINLILSRSLPDPDDGKVSLERTKVEGMADFIALPVSHPFIMRRPESINQTVAFLATGHFGRLVAFAPSRD